MFCSSRFDFIIKFHPDRWENEFALPGCSQEWEGAFVISLSGVGEGLTASSRGKSHACINENRPPWSWERTACLKHGLVLGRAALQAPKTGPFARCLSLPGAGVADVGEKGQFPF